MAGKRYTEALAALERVTDAQLMPPAFSCRSPI